MQLKFEPTPPSTYRSELDGLRGIAVLAVLGYHAGYNDFAGGFMGVDVFFVLSGYLITQQIRANQASGRFQLSEFWLRRLRRLLPAMFPVLLFSVLSALLLKGEGAFAAFTTHFLSAGLFFSNFQFLSEADYFARASDSNLLLHTWSLSLELQFYIVTPFVLMATARMRAWGAAIVLAGLAAASLIMAEMLIASDNSQWAFFGVLPRYWEFAAGGIIALTPLCLRRFPLAGFLLRLVGLGLVLWAIFGPVSATFPGFGAGWAVLGTALILLAPTDRVDPLRWCLELRWLRWVGLRSYAIYLIHWPLFVSVTPTAMNRSEGILSAALIASIVLGHFIYRYVELPIRTGPAMKSPAMMLKGAIIWGVAVVGLWAVLGSPASTILARVLPLSASRAALSELDITRDIYLDRVAFLDRAHLSTDHVRICSFDSIHTLADMMDCLSNLTPEPVLLMGDSHGRDTLLALMEAFPETDFVMLHNSNCVPARYTDCFDYLPELLDVLGARGLINRVVLSSRWGNGEHQFAGETLETLAGIGARVLVIGPGPTFSRHIEQHVLSMALRGEDLRETGVLAFDALAYDVAGANQELAGISASYGAGYVDRFGIFCAGADCRITTPDGSFAYQDNEHLTPAGISMYSRAIAAEPAVTGLFCGQDQTGCATVSR